MTHRTLMANCQAITEKGTAASATPRSVLFRLAAALAIHDYIAPGLDRDTRPGDAVAPAADIIHTPPEVTP